MYSEKLEQNSKLHPYVAAGIVAKSLSMDAIKITLIATTGSVEAIVGAIIHSAVLTVPDYMLWAQGALSLTAARERANGLSKFKSEPALQNLFTITGEGATKLGYMPSKTFRTLVIAEFLDESQPNPEQWQLLSDPDLIRFTFTPVVENTNTRLPEIEITLRELIQGSHIPENQTKNFTAAVKEWHSKLPKLRQLFPWTLKDEQIYIKSQVQIAGAITDLGNIATGKSAIDFMEMTYFQQLRAKVFRRPGTQLITATPLKVTPAGPDLKSKIISFCEWVAGRRI